MSRAVTREGTMSRRRAMVALAALVIGAITRPSAAGPGPKRVAVALWPSSAPDPIGPTKRLYAREFAKHGLVDGRDIEIVVIRVDEENFKRNARSARSDAARQAAALRPAVILTHAEGFSVKEYFLPAADGIPIVAWGADDGTADSLEALNRRGENVTGVMYSILELMTKRLELMKELKPGARRAAILNPQPQLPLTEKEEALKREAGARFASDLRKVGLEFTPVELPPDSSADVVIAALRKTRIDLVEVSAWFGHDLWEPLAKSGIAASGVGPISAERGALLGGWTKDIMTSSIRLAARIVRGARAADLPVERAREFGLAINTRTAKALGITVPASMLIRADEVPVGGFNPRPPPTLFN